VAQRYCYPDLKPTLKSQKRGGGEINISYHQMTCHEEPLILQTPHGGGSEDNVQQEQNNVQLERAKRILTEYKIDTYPKNIQDQIDQSSTLQQHDHGLKCPRSVEAMEREADALEKEIKRREAALQGQEALELLQLVNNLQHCVELFEIQFTDTTDTDKATATKELKTKLEDVIQSFSIYNPEAKV